MSAQYNKVIAAAPNRTSDEESDDMDELTSIADSQLKGPDTRWIPVCCTGHCCCHVTYIMCFLLYMMVFPFWCKWLLTAPMPFAYWGQGYPDFPRLPLKESTTAMKGFSGQPQIDISPIPSAQSSCNYSCSQALHGFRTSEMNFDITLRLNKPDLAEVSHSAFPVILTSEDFEHWQLVADRRHASPRPFFSEVTRRTSRSYVSVQEPCSKPPTVAGPSVTSKKAYIVACVSWTSQAATAWNTAKEVTQEDIMNNCDSLGGVCGWPCSSGIKSDVLESCGVDGKISQEVLDGMIGKSHKANGTVTLSACHDPVFSSAKECTTDLRAMSEWKCHKCVRRPLDLVRRLQWDFDDTDTLGDDDDDDTEDNTGDTTMLEYESLPRFHIMYSDVEVPSNPDILSTPRVHLFITSSLNNGSWEMIYNKVESNSEANPPLPVNQPAPKEEIPMKREDEMRTMSLLSEDTLTLKTDSCFGKRGPLYVVACAVNQSTYDSAEQWKNSAEMRFTPGQKVMPPPFNDRCLAVAGRCGHACEDNSVTLLPHCLPSGYIRQSALVGIIETKSNRVTPVYLFVYVLLFGFAVKTLTLCPGIFSPYSRCQTYDPELTEQLKYVLVVGVTGGGDEGKGTMIRNTIGMVSGLPPDCRCHFVVCNNEEGHRLEMLTCWKKFCQVLACMPNTGPNSYERNLRKFLATWCDETKKMALTQLGGQVKKLDAKIVERLSGKTTFAKLQQMQNGGWDHLPAEELEKLGRAIDALHEDLDTKYNVFTMMTPQFDYIEDWLPPNPQDTALRMHFTSRARPVEDPRNMIVQHIAVGTWYYRVPHDAQPDQWLELRKNCRMMEYNESHDDEDASRRVPLRSSHGKAGGLNFVDNYMSMVYNRREYQISQDEEDDRPSLYAIADARHQYQPDFFTSCIPCFFDEDMQLNNRVGFTQAPQHYPEYSDKYDYLDNNNAQFFRLNAMIRNCCGGVSSCGTNGMWQIEHRDPTTVWQQRRKRVRDKKGRKSAEQIEREQFHTSCKIEDTASSLDRVLVGQYSHFINRKLSFGMCKNPEGFLGAQQRWVEGAITLCLQWTTSNADSHGQAKRSGWLLWLVILAFTFWVIALFHLVTQQTTTSVLVQIGFLSDATYRELMAPFLIVIHFFYSWLLDERGGFSANSENYGVYEEMTLQFVIWVLTILFVFFILWVFTNTCKTCRRCINFPSEMRWWGRLLISFDNLTYWLWFWTSFFWIGFNVFLALKATSFHFNNIGMMGFMLLTTVLNYALIFANCFRFSIEESIDANEIAFLSMDNIWRANQLFFIVGPIQAFSVITGTKAFLSYLLYGQDIGGWSGGDMTQVSIAIVKFWTTFIIFSAIACWVALLTSGCDVDEFQSRRPGCIIFTFIAMDVLHPCVYLWTVGSTLTDEQVKQMTYFECFNTMAWWKHRATKVILNEFMTNIFRFVFPAYMVILPILVFYNSYFAVSSGFSLVSVGAGH